MLPCTQIIARHGLRLPSTSSEPEWCSFDAFSLTNFKEKGKLTPFFPWFSFAKKGGEGSEVRGEGPGGPLHLSVLWSGCAAGRLRALRRRRKPHIFEPRTQREDQQRHSEKQGDRAGSTWTDYRALQRVQMPRTGTSLSPL